MHCKIRRNFKKSMKLEGLINHKSKRPVEGAPGAAEGEKYDSTRGMGLTFSTAAK
jgi:hypothetical protein